MTVNVKSMFLTCKHVIPVMLANGGGSIVNVSSLSGVRALRPEVAYAASKAAVNGLTINIAMGRQELAILAGGLVGVGIIGWLLSKVQVRGGGQKVLDSMERAAALLSKK